MTPLRATATAWQLLLYLQYIDLDLPLPHGLDVRDGGMLLSFKDRVDFLECLANRLDPIHRL